MPFTPEQWKQRALGIGASEAAASIGLSSYTSRLGLYMKKQAQLAGEYSEDLTDQDLLRLDGGLALEPVILRHFERSQGLTLSDYQLSVQDPKYPWRWVTLDARASNGAPVEAKKTEIIGAQWGEGEEDIPDDYYCQTQQSMACTGASFVYVPVLLPRWNFAVYTIQRDEEFIELMTVKQLDFIRRLNEKDPPPPESLADCKLAWPKHKALKAVEADEETYAAAVELATVKKKIKELETRSDSLELTVKASMMDAEVIRNVKGPIATWTNNKDGEKFNNEQFAIDHPELYRKYLEPTQGARVFRLKLKTV